MTTPSAQPGRNHQAPRGTRDFYPIEMARRLWLEDKWRRTATRHGFDEISGPTFEHLDLYTVKSGEGIVSELFSFTRDGGETAYALRPEFTPTLARMVAAKANALPKPIKWHSIGPYFRAERPQRGRLREFTQWNVDMLMDPSPEADADVIACCVDALRAMGLDHDDAQVHINDRTIAEWRFLNWDAPRESFPMLFALLDSRGKVSDDEIKLQAVKLGASAGAISDYLAQARPPCPALPHWNAVLEYYGVDINEIDPSDTNGPGHEADIPPFRNLESVYYQLRDRDLLKWCVFDEGLYRGLAYYTGTVFEVHETGGKERAIAGGGRYDNLVELFGGPPTPAVGFAMGDVVIALVLQDKGLMPSDDAIARDMGLAPDVFVIASEEAADAHLRPVLAHLRRAGLHARRSYKSTRNVGKLLGEASKANTRFALILKPDLTAELKDMGAQGGAVVTLGPAASAQELAAVAQRHIPAP